MKKKHRHRWGKWYRIGCGDIQAVIRFCTKQTCPGKQVKDI